MDVEVIHDDEARESRAHQARTSNRGSAQIDDDIELEILQQDQHAVVNADMNFRRQLEEDALFKNQDDYGMGVDSRKSKWIVPVHHPFRNYWDVIIILALLFTCIVTPFEVAFLTPVINALFIINRFIDFIFLADMGLTMMTPVLDERTGVWISTNQGIFREYVRFWFWIDLLSVIPFDAISVAAEGADENLQGIRLLRLLRLIKLARIVRASRVIKRREAEMEIKYSTMSFIKFSVIILFLTHWIACLMGLLPQLDGQSYDFLTAEEIANGSSPFSWITVYFEDGLGLEYGDYNIWSVYLAGCYFACMTLTTIGYGDVTPKSDVERGVVVFVMLAGATFYAYAVGNMCSIIQSMDQLRTEFHRECDDFANFLDNKHFPEADKLRLKKFVHFTWAKKKAQHHRSLLHNLSKQLQREIAFELSHEWVERIPFLSEDISPRETGEYDKFVQLISLRLRPEAFPAQETLILKQDNFDKLYLIERGSVFLHLNPLDFEDDDNSTVGVPKSHHHHISKSKSLVHSELSAGASFGAEIIVDHFVSNYFVSCATDVDMLTLTREDLHAILEQLPITKLNLKKLAKRKHWEQFKKHKGKMNLYTHVEDDEDLELGSDFLSEDAKEIVSINQELQDLTTRLANLREQFKIKEQLLKVLREDGLDIVQ